MIRGRRTRPVPKRMARGGIPAPKRMARGGIPAPKRMARGGIPAPAGRGRKMPAGGQTCGMSGQPPCPGGGYRRGGKTIPVPRKKYQTGGAAGAACPAGTERTADGNCTFMGS